MIGSNMYRVVCVALVGVVMQNCTYDKANAQTQYFTESGEIIRPINYRTEWTFIGTWSIADEKQASAAAMGHGIGAAGLHNVYTQPETVQAFRATGQFPDGAVLVKELLKGKTAGLTTGTASWGEDIEGWFVMIKDRQSRFEGNPLWGLGWGWALFKVDNPSETVTKDFRRECVGCHIPAKDTDWIYISGYPLLRE